MDWNDVAQSIRFGRLVAADGWTYQFTSGDLPWAVRYVVGEIGDYGSTDEAWVILWAMGNRLYKTWPRYSTYAKLVVAYSIALHGDVTEVPRRARIQSLQPSDVPASTIGRVKAFLEGRVQPGIAVGISHQDTCPPGNIHHDLGPADYIGPSGECYWKSDDTVGWTASTIGAVPAGGASGGGSVLVGLAALAGAMFGSTKVR